MPLNETYSHLYISSQTTPKLLVEDGYFGNNTLRSSFSTPVLDSLVEGILLEYNEIITNVTTISAAREELAAIAGRNEQDQWQCYFDQ